MHRDGYPSTNCEYSRHILLPFSRRISSMIGFYFCDILVFFTFQSQSALFQIPYLLPCVCVEVSLTFLAVSHCFVFVFFLHIYLSCLYRQVFHKYQDAWRHKKCPFQNGSLIGECDTRFTCIPPHG